MFVAFLRPSYPPVSRLSTFSAQNRSQEPSPNVPACCTRDKLLGSLVDLEHESEVTASTLEHVIGSIDALLTSRSTARGSKIGPRSLSALRAVAAAMTERLHSLSAANQEVRKLLLCREEAEAALQLSEDHRDTLLKQNSELKSMNRRFQKELIEKEDTIHDLHSKSKQFL